MQIEQIEINLINEYENNVKIHTDEQKREYILIHNKLTMNTGFDMERLEKELDEIETDLSLYGFEQFEEFFEELDEDIEEIEDEEPTDETVKLTIKFSRTEYEAVVEKLETINNDHRLALLELLGGD